MRTLYRQFKDGLFDQATLPMKGKRKPNGHQERRGKEFSNWKTLCNQYDVAIFFANPGTPSQRSLNENSNSLLRKDGLPKEMDFNQVNQAFITSVADKRNQIPRNYLNYDTPLEVLSSYVNESDLSSLY